MIEPSPARPHRRLFVIGAALGGMLLGLLILTRMSGGSADQVGVEAPRRVAPGAAPVSSTPEGSQFRVEDIPVLGGRDPFQQVVTVPKQAASAGGESPPVAPASVPPVSAPPAETVPPTEVPPVSAPDAPVDPQYAFLTLASITRDGVAAPRAHITVDGDSYDLVEGEVFSYGFRLELISQRCVEVSSRQDRLRMCLPTTAPKS